MKKALLWLHLGHVSVREDNSNSITVNMYNEDAISKDRLAIPASHYRTIYAPMKKSFLYFEKIITCKGVYIEFQNIY